MTFTWNATDPSVEHFHLTSINIVLIYRHMGLVVYLLFLQNTHFFPSSVGKTFYFFGEDKEDFILCEMKWDNINLLTYKIAFFFLYVYPIYYFHWFLGKSRVHPLNRGWRYVRACHNSIIISHYLFYIFQVLPVNLRLFILFIFYRYFWYEIKTRVFWKKVKQPGLNSLF